MLFPWAFIRAAYHTSRPCPREAHRESTTQIFRSGYRSDSSWAAIWAEWQVADRPEEKAIISTSLPACTRGSTASV